MTIVTSGETLDVDTTWFDSATSSTVSGSVLYGGVGGPVYLSGVFAVTDTIVQFGGSLDVLSGGTAIDTAVLSHGEEDVDSGGVAIGTVVSGGGTIVSGGEEDIVYGDLYVSSGGSALGTVLGFNGQEFVYSGGIANGTVVSSAGYEHVGAGGVASGTIISSGGVEDVEFGGDGSGTVVSGGGYVELPLTSAYGQWSTNGPNVIDGVTVQSGAIVGIEIFQGGSISGFVGDDYVLSGGVANGTVVVGLEGVALGGVVNGTVVLNGAEQYLGGVANRTVVNSGGFEYVDGVANGTVILSGGSANVNVGAVTSGMVLSGGEEDVGGTAISTTIDSGGVEIVYSIPISFGSSGGTTSDTVISGGTLDLEAGAIVSGSIAFASGTSGTLEIDGTTMPTNVISGLAPGDRVDLAGVQFESAAAATIFQAGPTPSDNFVLHVVSGGATYDLQLDSSQPFLGGLSCSADQSGHGTGITVTSGVATGYSTSATTSNVLGSVSPYLGVCQITDFRDGKPYGGTGFIIGSNTVLTAAHVVESSGTDLATNISVYPGVQSAFGGKPVDGTAAPNYQYYETHPLTDVYEQYDLAVVYCPEAHFPTSDIFLLQGGYSSGTVNDTGYPGTISGMPSSMSGTEQTTQFNQIGTVSKVPAYHLLSGSDLTAVPGDSGSPLWVYDGLSLAAVGVVATNYSGTTTLADAVQFTSSDKSLISGWQSAFTTISSGQTASARVVAGGNTLDVLGTAHNTVVNSGGTENVYGSDSSAVVSDGGYQYIQSGGTATGTILKDPGTQIVASGGMASGAILSGGIQEVDFGGVAGNTVIVSGGRQYVSTGGVASGGKVKIGGDQYVLSGGTARGTVLSGGGEIISSGGTASGTIGSSGATERVYGRAFGGTVVSGGRQIVETGGVASGATVKHGGVQTVFSGGTTRGTLLSGGVETVRGTASGTIVKSGGTEIVSGRASGATISGGLIEIASGGAASGTIAFVSGGTLQLDAGASFTGAVKGFGIPDRIDLRGVAFGSGTKESFKEALTNTSGTLTVTSGTHTVHLTLLGVYSSTNFKLATDGKGGTLVTDPPAASGAARTTFADIAPAQPPSGAADAGNPANYLASAPATSPQTYAGQTLLATGPPDGQGGLTHNSLLASPS